MAHVVFQAWLTLGKWHLFKHYFQEVELTHTEPQLGVDQGTGIQSGANFPFVI